MLSRSRNARRAVVVGLGVAALAAAGLVSNALAGSGAAPTIKVVLKEWTLTPSTTTVPAGAVTFVVRNSGGIPHELVVVKTSRHHHALPMKGSQAVETGDVGEIEEILPGKTKRVTIKLKPGKYVLLCNLEGHYRAGQYASLTVR